MLSSKQKPKTTCGKNGKLFPMLKIIRIETVLNKTKIFLTKVQVLARIVSDKRIQPGAKKFQDMTNFRSPENTKASMRILGSLDFYSTFIRNLNVDSKLFCELLRDDIPFKWTAEHDKLFQNVKGRISEGTVMAVPNREYPLYTHLDSSSIVTGSILVQEIPRRKCLASFIFPVLTKDERKMSSLHRELCGIVSAPQTYEHFIIDSTHPAKIIRKHQPL